MGGTRVSLSELGCDLRRLVRAQELRRTRPRLSVGGDLVSADMSLGDTDTLVHNTDKICRQKKCNDWSRERGRKCQIGHPQSQFNISLSQILAINKYKKCDPRNEDRDRNIKPFFLKCKPSENTRHRGGE